MIFDTHTHLNAEQFNDDIPETIAHAQELGVTEMAVVGFDAVSYTHLTLPTKRIV